MDVFASLAHEDELEQNTAANSRAVEAAKVRVSHQFGAYISLAKSPEDFEARISMIEERAVKLAEATVEEYGSTDLDSVMEAVSEALHTAAGHKGDCGCGFCKNKGKGFGKDKELDKEADEVDSNPIDKDKDFKDDDEKESRFNRESERSSIWHTAADEPDTGDSYHAVREDVTTDTLPTTDKGTAGDNTGTSMKPIDVPSTRNRSELQSVSEGDGYGTYTKGGDPNPASEVRTQIDADKGIMGDGHEVAPNTDTWTGTDGLANAVSSKWRVVT